MASRLKSENDAKVSPYFCVSAIMVESGVSEGPVMIKVAPQVGRRHGETVCVAAIDDYGSW